ncbi:hypothetical protein GCM10009632_43940 [Mycolicibacterium alvei]|uniref:Uncharacterized protein n=1 Tax=Mycolicibacterium alvei TaxID=67081 RepID=A0A6N4URY8_9MYCO|nr:hypothetical protein MALV_13370 [Mycolicibacterium alvei]
MSYKVDVDLVFQQVVVVGNGDKTSDTVRVISAPTEGENANRHPRELGDPPLRKACRAHD